MKIYELSKIQNTLLKEIRWTTRTHRQLNQIRETMEQQNKLDKEIETIKKKSPEILELKYTITKVKNLIDIFKGRLDYTK